MNILAVFLNKSIKKNGHSLKDSENWRTLSKLISMNISIKIAFVDHDL